MIDYPVCIDRERACLTNPRWRYNTVTHLVSRDIEKLHRFAKRIGLQRSWFQNALSLPHYDLSPRMRKVAIAHGAEIITDDQLFKMIRDYRQGKL